jgi:hypothetical protein
MNYLEKLHAQGRFDIHLQPQGKADNGKIACMVRVEILDQKEDGSLTTKRKVSCYGFGSSIKSAQTAALKDAVTLLGI